MKKILGILTALFMAVCMTSCLEHDLEELEVYSDCDITGRDIYWRWVSDEVHPGTGANKVKQVRIPNGVWTVVKNDDEAGEAEATFVIQFSQSFEQFKGKLDMSKDICVYVNLSQGAICEPIEGSAVLGAPGDWSKPNKYKVTAADGSVKIWTLSISEIRQGHWVGL
jgi:hypothetical protein